MNAGMYSSSTCEWETPQELFDRLDAIYHFETDVCATAENAKCVKYYTKEQDWLAQEWRGVCWMNPPYGREIGKWMRKAYASAQAGAVVVCLVPSRTDEEAAFWQRVRDTCAVIGGKTPKKYSADALTRWYNGLHTDSAEYKMWGNGIALPCARYVLEGVADELRNPTEEETAGTPWEGENGR